MQDPKDLIVDDEGYVVGAKRHPVFTRPLVGGQIMAQSRYTPSDFVALVRAQPGVRKVTKIQEAMLYGMVLGRIQARNKTDGKISHKEAEKLIAVYNAHVTAMKR